MDFSQSRVGKKYCKAKRLVNIPSFGQVPEPLRAKTLVAQIFDAIGRRIGPQNNAVFGRSPAFNPLETEMLASLP
jgi:hypothetical protein